MHTLRDTQHIQTVNHNYEKNQLMIKYLTFGISISFISWIVGMTINNILVKTEYYKKISNLNFIKSNL